MKRSTFLKFTAPSIFVMTLLMVIPLIMAIWLGMQFMTYVNINDPQFVGLRNYIDTLQDPRFWQSFRFTGLYMVIIVPAQLVIGFTIVHCKIPVFGNPSVSRGFIWLSLCRLSWSSVLRSLCFWIRFHGLHAVSICPFTCFLSSLFRLSER